MGIRIDSVMKKEVYPDILRDFLPLRLCDELTRFGGNRGRIEEIRLRSDARAAITTSYGSFFLRSIISRSEMNDILSAICDNSLYAHSDTINKGYVTLRGGIRVGVCGRAAIDGGRVIGIYDISALNIRIPSYLRFLGDPVCSLLRQTSESRGVLIYSPPGVGKTTLLRSVAYKMASGDRALRIALIDTRGELGCINDIKNVSIDILSGYPKGVGIEIAARTMNPQLMICDEIGDDEEANSIIAAQNCGVPLLASAHGDTVEGLLRRTAIMKLHMAGVFEFYVGIERRMEGGEYRYTVTTAEEANVFLQNSGRVASGT